MQRGQLMEWSGRAPAPPADYAGEGGCSNRSTRPMPRSTTHPRIAVAGIDIGKNTFHVVGHEKFGAIVLRQKWSRGQVESRFANMPPCLIGMEACVGALTTWTHGYIEVVLRTSIPTVIISMDPSLFKRARSASGSMERRAGCQGEVRSLMA